MMINMKKQEIVEKLLSNPVIKEAQNSADEEVRNSVKTAKIIFERIGEFLEAFELAAQKPEVKERIKRAIVNDGKIVKTTSGSNG